MNLPLGQFYNITVNNRDPYLVCGGLQDNGNWCTPSATKMDYGISFRDAFNIGNADGMQAVFEDDHTLVVSAQNGSTVRLDLNNMEHQTIAGSRPQDHSQSAYRWYWTAPLLVSSFNSNTIYTGANFLFRSDDRGVNWRAVSPDVTADIDREQLQMMGAPVPQRALSRHDGQANYSALTAIAESPLDANLLYTGADDGTLEVTRDGGKKWSNLTGNLSGLPPRLSISSITSSKYSAGRVYLTVDGHFDDNYHPYIMVSEDYGRSWRSIAQGLPQTSVHRLREHPTNPNVLVAGLETGVFASFDRGGQWTTLDTNLPPVPVYDLVYQERDNALVLGTHGRGIWILDHAEPLAEIKPELLSTGYLFPVPPTHYRTVYTGQYWFGAGEFFAPNPPLGAVITYYLPTPTGDVQITIADGTGKTIRTLRGPSQPGINRTCWDLRRATALDTGIPLPGNCHPAAGRFGPTVLPGNYKVTVTAGGSTFSGTVTVLTDPEFPVSDGDRKTREAAVMSAYSLQQQLAAARQAYEKLSGQLAGMRTNSAAPGAVDKLTAQATEVLEQIAHCLTDTYNVESAIDAYQGLPTTAQLRDLDRLWSDGIAAVAGLNRSIEETGVSGAAVPVPVR
jgi:hypothetical protein